jgi:hypothetical protein
LMISIENDGIWAMDNSGSWVREKNITMDSNWHVYKVKVNRGNAEVYMDGIYQFTYLMQSDSSTDRIEHWTIGSSDNATEAHVDYTNIF